MRQHEEAFDRRSKAHGLDGDSRPARDGYGTALAQRVYGAGNLQ